MKVIPLIFCLSMFLATNIYGSDYVKSLSMLNAKDILPKEQLTGENFHIDMTVRNDGLINYYILDTDYGRIDAEGTHELLVRIDELNALVLMEKLKASDVFTDSLTKGVKGIGEGAVELITSPIDTSKEIAAGAGQFFSNIGEAFVSDDPSQDNALKVAIGYDVAKRQFAYEFGINPYTGYKPVVNRLGEISQAAVAGGIAPKAALSAVGGGWATAARVSGTMRGMQLLVRDNPPNKLREINYNKLREMGVSESLSEAFLDNYAFDPYEKTLLIGELESMDVSGSELFISRANLAKKDSMALFYRILAQMMGNYHRDIKPVAAIERTAGVLHLKRKDGGHVVLAPLDYVFWIDGLMNKVDAFDEALKQGAFAGAKELWITGRFDPVAKKELAKRNWDIVEDSQSRLLKAE